MTRFQTLLVPIDFSAHSDKALDCAIGLAKTFGSKIHLIHAYHLPIQVASPDQVVIPQNFWGAVRDSAARKLEKTVQKVKAAGVDAETHLAEMSPVQAINQTAEKVVDELSASDLRVCIIEIDPLLDPELSTRGLPYLIGSATAA